MKVNICIIIIISLLSCNEPDKIKAQEKNNLAVLTELHENYKKFWLENDSTKVINLFADDGAIIPPGNKGDFVKGKKAIGAWWFTKNGDTTYPITVFKYVKDSLLYSPDISAWEGVAEFEWKTMVHDSVIASHSSTTNFMTVCKKENGAWKIFRQIWNVRPKI